MRINNRKVLNFNKKIGMDGLENFVFLCKNCSIIGKNLEMIGGGYFDVK